jgi:hypothetical protein
MNDKKKLLLGIILFGSLWGGLEAFGIRLMDSLSFSPKSPILAATGILILGMARVIFPRRGTTFLIGLFAAGFKFLTLPQIFMCQVEAVIVQGLVLEVAFSYAQSLKVSRWFSLGFVSILSMYLNYFVFAILQTYIVLNPYWAEQGFSKVLSYIFIEGTYASVLCFFFVNLGFALGKYLTPAFNQWQAIKAKTYGMATLLVSLGCWISGFMLYR